jgi:hypothetical protein
MNSLASIHCAQKSQLVLVAPTIEISARTSTTLTVHVVSNNYPRNDLYFDVYYSDVSYVSIVDTSMATITGLWPTTKYNLHAVARHGAILSPASNTLSNQQTYVYATPIQTDGTPTYQTNSSTSTDTFTVSGATFSYANGSYVFSGSSADSTVHRAHRAFNNSASESHLWACAGSGGTNVYSAVYSQTPYNNTTGLYQGGGSGRFWTTTVSAVGISGEWIQVKLPYSFVAKSFQIIIRANYSARIVKTSTLAGSNDGTTWTLLSNPAFDANVYDKTFSLESNTTAYTYYRYIVQTDYNGTVVNFYSLRLLGHVYVA